MYQISVLFNICLKYFQLIPAVQPPSATHNHCTIRFTKKKLVLWIVWRQLHLWHIYVPVSILVNFSHMLNVGWKNSPYFIESLDYLASRSLPPPSTLSYTSIIQSPMYKGCVSPSEKKEQTNILFNFFVRNCLSTRLFHNDQRMITVGVTKRV